MVEFLIIRHRPITILMLSCRLIVVDGDGKVIE